MNVGSETQQTANMRDGIFFLLLSCGLVVRAWTFLVWFVPDWSSISMSLAACICFWKYNAAAHGVLVPKTVK